MLEIVLGLELVGRANDPDPAESTALNVFALTLRRGRRHLMALITAIGTGRYFQAWLAATLLRAALTAAEHSVSSQSATFKTRSQQQLGAFKALAAPMLELAPAPSCIEVRELGATRKHAEEAWRRFVLDHRLSPRVQDHPDSERSCADDHHQDSARVRAGHNGLA